uniref:Uncharacterized protein n=1 Tax=Anguilla anguilla TaxID=7936 RepID=A0A0E9UF41_ANGAN
MAVTHNVQHFCDTPHLYQFYWLTVTRFFGYEHS